LAIVPLLGCGRSTAPSILAISDVTQTNTMNLVSAQRGGFVSGLTLRIQGHLDGTGYVFAANWPTQALSGAVNSVVYEDYFQTSCTLHYHPVGVRAGSLNIQYEFH
jgi:hypothetical protein